MPTNASIGGSMDQLGTLSICYDIIIGLLATGTSGSPNFGRPLLKHGRKFGRPLKRMCEFLNLPFLALSDLTLCERDRIHLSSSSKV